MAESKKVWVEPELIVLVRNKPEEAVLGACKTIGVNGDIANTDNACMYIAGCSDPCSSLMGS